MSLELWFTFVLATIIFSIAPGASMLAIISNSVSVGFQKAAKNILGLQLGLLSHLVIVSLGLGALLATSALAFTILKYVGAAYLLYLGFSKLFSRKGKPSTDNESSSGLFTNNLILQGFVVNMMNPKSIIFLAAFLPQFLRPEFNLTIQYTVLGCTVLLVDSVVMFCYAFMATSVKPYLIKPKFIKLQNRIFGSLFITMGVLLARSEKVNS